MKKIGLVGGISWASSVDYYRYINEVTNKRLGGLNFAECLLYSVNFEYFRKYNAAYDWDSSFELLSAAALQLRNAGAELIILGANTAHIVAERVAAVVDLPLIDIRIATANAIMKRGIRKVALLGTTYTMELDFYRNKLAEYGIESLIPEKQTDRDFIEQTLVDELGRGIIKAETKAAYIRIANELIRQGAEGIILGCTEIPLLLSQADFTVPVFNTTEIHATAAVEFALSN
ncbi:aspartate/glutamate racemase family protein [Sediminibacterium ginsengisoli]|uniref:Aspartate racemase n=1 Tax=Sediminibacterium ginsengisoli TaxID=413434 RepID=A0A1T4LB95_9BACT|nr:aspartate/glutamate racemase family protein [Sediminibacterium ginsengisoli]SJZ51804.1 aspartate racemase [Sediminibacterium ginsengisoli]